MQRALFLGLVCAVVNTLTPLQAHLYRPGAPQTQPILIRGVCLHPVSGPDIVDGLVLVVDGKIKDIGPTVTIPTGAVVIEAKGKHLYPGLISAYSSLGLMEVAQVRATLDVTETGSLNPNARAEISLNPDSELLPIMRSNGILTALSVPQSPVGWAGASALIHLEGWTTEDLLVKAPVGLHFFWPNLAINYDSRFPKSPEKQRQDLTKLLAKQDEFMAQARAYDLNQTEKKGTAPKDLRFEAMRPLWRGQLPVFIHASELRQVEAALDWADKWGVKCVLVGGLEAWRVADRLKAKQIPVLVTTTFDLPENRDDDFDAGYTAARKLSAAGLPFCLASTGDLFVNGQDRNLPYQAAMAAAHGLSKAEALRAVTLSPAQILGVGDRLGSLEKGKEATMILTDGDPLEVTTHVERAWINGREVNLTNRQTELYQKYKSTLSAPTP